jgi:SAM-dependent methyltransferase
VRPVELRGQRHYQLASRRGSQEVHENLAPDAALTRIESEFGTHYEHAHLMTAAADFHARIARGGAVQVKRSKPSRQASAGPTGESHDRARQHVIAEGRPCAFLAEIGVMTPDGTVRASRRKKFRQVNRYLELAGDIIGDLPAEGPLRVVDFGCGKSYLTFALHHLLTAIHGREVEIVGLDRKADVIADCRRIADRLGCRGLSFEAGDIATHDPGGPVHLAVSLHACDTATDDAIAQAVRWQSDVILAVPCCQHELAAKLGGDFLPAVQRHGILKDRLAAIVTDALRSAALEACGYRAQVVEFIDMEHTAKNVLIRAVRRPAPPPASALQEYRSLKASAGLEEIHLDRVLGDSLAAKR